MATERRLLGWLQQVANARGFDVLGAQSSNQIEPLQRFVENCQSRGVDGLMVMAFANDELLERAAPLLTRFSRVVALVGNPGIPGVPSVESDMAGGTRTSIEHLHKQGRRKIVQILEGLDTALNRSRHKAFVETHRELERPFQDDQICIATRGWSEFDFAKMDPLCAELLDRGADAVLADTDFTASMVLRSLRRLGKRVPDDVAVVGWGNEELAAWQDPQLTTVSYAFREVAAEAVDLLSQWLEKPTTFDFAESRIVPMKLIVRESA
jgi:LacI family transcriptional regulator